MFRKMIESFATMSGEKRFCVHVGGSEVFANECSATGNYLRFSNTLLHHAKMIVLLHVDQITSVSVEHEHYYGGSIPTMIVRDVRHYNPEYDKPDVKASIL